MLREKERERLKEREKEGKKAIWNGAGLVKEQVFVGKFWVHTLPS